MKPKPLSDLSGKELRKREILDAAFEEFANSGCRGPTMLEIAGRARASKATLYSCFRNKRDLFEALLRSHVDRITLRLSLDFAQKADPYEILHDLAHSILTITTRPEWVALMRI